MDADSLSNSNDIVDDAIGRLVDKYAAKPDARDNIKALFASRERARLRTKLLAGVIRIFQQLGEKQVSTDKFAALVQHLGREHLFGEQAVTSLHHLRTAIGMELRGPSFGLTVKRTDSGRFYVISSTAQFDPATGELVAAE